MSTSRAPLTRDPLSRDQVEARLAQREPRLLRAVLDAAQVPVTVENNAMAYARLLLDTLWWRTHSPASGVILPDDLGAIVNTVERRLRLDLGSGDTWSRLDALANQLVPNDRPLAIDALSAADQARLRHAIWGELFGSMGAASSFGARWLSRSFLGWARGPLWDLLMMIPQLGPVLRTVRGGAGAVSAVSGPVGILLALMALNQALGPRYDRALPLLVGIGLVLKNPLVPSPTATTT